MSYGVSLNTWRGAPRLCGQDSEGQDTCGIRRSSSRWKFEYIVNLKAAKQIGLTIPPNVLARADRVIR